MSKYEAVLLPSTVFTVIVVVPPAPFKHVTLPSASTVATDWFEDSQVTALLVAFSGRTVAVSVNTSPAFYTVVGRLPKDTLSTGTTATTGVAGCSG